ncbi:MAG: Uma2 family endonuclease [Spirochaetaceae bacterium]|nr:Uma2 family endonuclease [Spirochaetaceae bacterium]
MKNSALAAAQVGIDYPTTDGEPMAETDAQGIPLMYAVTGLRDYFRHRPDVYVSGNLLVYYEAGNLDASVAPDVFVVLGVPNHMRPTYRIWEEGKGPDFVLEITSRHTRANDEGPKRELYQRLGVQEYWRYDPTGDYLEPPLHGLELSGGAYRRLRPSWLADGTQVMYSAVLELELRIERDELRFRDPVSGERVRTLSESNEERRHEAAARRHAEHKRRQEAVARRAAEARVAELEALLKQRR